MSRTDRQLPGLLGRLRWIIPVFMAGLGAGYILLEHLLIIPNLLSPLQILRQTVIIGIVGPTLTWVLLSWATKIARFRQQAEASLERRALQLETASQVSQKVTAILDVDELLAQVVRLIQDQFGYYHVHLFLVDGHSHELVLRQCSGPAHEPLLAHGPRLKIGEQGLTGWVAQTGQFVLCNDVAQESRYYPHELLPQTRSELALPLRIGNVVVGVLDVQSKQRDAFQPDDVVALQILGDQIAIAIENANLFQETRRQFEAMQALHGLSLELTSRLESQRVLEAILEQATQLLNAQGSALCILYPGEDKLENIAVHNLPLEFQGVTLRPGEGVAGQVVATGQPLIVNDYPHWQQRSLHFRASPFDAVIGVPLRWQGQVIGALTVLDQGERRPFTGEDTRLLSLFADLASIALKNAELYAQVVQLSQQLEQKVEQRTNELVKAQDELAQKAEQLQRLLTVTLQIQEEERARIARDLHDGSNQLITGTLFEIQAAQQCILGRRGENAAEKLETAKSLLRQIDAENRRLIAGLRPSILDAQGVAPALKWYAANLQERYNLTCFVQVGGRPVRLPSEAEIAVYRILQESLNNVVRHARAHNIHIRVDFKPNRLRIVVEDDGIGFDWPSAMTGVSTPWV
ncbi:MAG: GAF domain-containing sensor histidine kinase [Anaerolineae bacterium]